MEGSQTVPPLEGYAAVAAWVALDPDNETFVFRKFDRLAARNLLYLQSELLAIEKDLDRLDRDDVEAAQDAARDLTAKDKARTWAESSRAHDGRETETHRRNLVEKLRSKMKEYRTAFCLAIEHKPLTSRGDGDRRSVGRSVKVRLTLRHQMKRCSFRAK